MWNPDGIGWVLLTFGMDALIVAAILFAVREVSTFLQLERGHCDPALKKIRELHQAGEITREDFETLQRGLERLSAEESFEMIQRSRGAEIGRKSHE